MGARVRWVVLAGCTGLIAALALSRAPREAILHDVARGIARGELAVVRGDRLVRLQNTVRDVVGPAQASHTSLTPWQLQAS